MSKGCITKSINESDLYLSKEIEKSKIHFGKNTVINIIKNKKIDKIGAFSSIKKSGITTYDYPIILQKTENDNEFIKNSVKDVREIKHTKLDQETYQAAKDFATISGYDFTQNFYLKLIRKKQWVRVYVDNIKTFILYHHFKHENPQDTISLPLFNPSFSKRLYFDIDDNQIKGISVNNIIKQLEKDLGRSYYKEGKYSTGQKGAHLFYEFEHEIFEEGRQYLEKYYLEKYGYKIEANLKIMRLPWSKAYYKGAVDSNNNKIENAAHLVEVFRKGQSLPIPKFLKEHNKHGIALSKTRNFTPKEISIDELVISRGNRVKPMITLAFYAISKNYTLQQYSDLCYDKNDITNPSKDLSGRYSRKIIENIYNWAERNFNKDLSYYENDIVNNKKYKEFLNEDDFELSDKEYDVFKEILRYKDPFKNTKSLKIKKRQELDTLLMTEAIYSMFKYEEAHPSGNYKIKEFEPLNKGIPIALKTVELIAKKYDINNWKKIWKIVKSIFLKLIVLKNGYSYSYCNLRYAKHYILLSLNNILKSILQLYKKLNNFSGYKKYYYNICEQNLNINIIQIMCNSNLLRAGP